ncbi:MAG: hypothetical protein B6D41_18700 [Chloroflexi bacterium UTCFX4]|jgi:hypothetical protein|nr:MAG: hypothetical protein B6D41_18700 [Chloroflexi bacterium UTCFX4]
MKRYALVMITHFKPTWNALSEEAQASFAARIRRAAQAVEVTPFVGYTLTTPGALLEIWEADHRERLEHFKQKLDALGYKEYYDSALLFGERDANWIEE